MQASKIRRLSNYLLKLQLRAAVALIGMMAIEVSWTNGGEQHIKDIAFIFDEKGRGWTHFSGTGWHGWNPNSNNTFTTDASQNWLRDASYEI